MGRRAFSHESPFTAEDSRKRRPHMVILQYRQGWKEYTYEPGCGQDLEGRMRAGQKTDDA